MSARDVALRLADLYPHLGQREGCVMKFYKLTERYTGERDVYVYASSKADALVAARNGDSVDEGEPTHFDYRYVGPVEEVVPDGER